MAHKDTRELAMLAHSLAKKIRQQPGTTDEMYQLLSIFHARLKLLEEASLTPQQPARDWRVEAF